MDSIDCENGSVHRAADQCRDYHGGCREAASECTEFLARALTCNPLAVEVRRTFGGLTNRQDNFSTEVWGEIRAALMIQFA